MCRYDQRGNGKGIHVPGTVTAMITAVMALFMIMICQIEDHGRIPGRMIDQEGRYIGQVFELSRDERNHEKCDQWSHCNSMSQNRTAGNLMTLEIAPDAAVKYT